MDSKKIIAIIPARGGSKRVPLKNIKLLAKKPLVAFTIERARESCCFDRIIVSTDNKKIAEISEKYGAEIIKRPKKIAGDNAKNEQVILHALGVFEKKSCYPDIVVLLQPTSPLRSAEDIKNSIEVFRKNNKCESVFSVSSVDVSKHNGAIWVFKPEVVKKYQSLYLSKKIPYTMPEERSVDIDNESDFIFAESIIKNENKK